MKYCITICHIILLFDVATVFGFSLSNIFGTVNDPELPKECYGNDISESLKSGINDVIVVKQTDGHTLNSTAFQARIGKLSNWRTLLKSRTGKLAKLYVNNVRAIQDAAIVLGDSGAAYIQRKKSSEPTCSFTESELREMRLHEGQNTALLAVDDFDLTIPFSIYLLKHDNFRNHQKLQFS